MLYINRELRQKGSLEEIGLTLWRKLKGGQQAENPEALQAGGETRACCGPPSISAFGSGTTQLKWHQDTHTLSNGRGHAQMIYRLLKQN